MRVCWMVVELVLRSCDVVSSHDHFKEFSVITYIPTLRRQPQDPHLRLCALRTRNHQENEPWNIECHFCHWACLCCFVGSRVSRHSGKWPFQTAADSAFSNVENGPHPRVLRLTEGGLPVTH